MKFNTTLYFNAKQAETINFTIYDQLGKIVYQTNFKTVVGTNQMQVQKQNLSSGLYYCKTTSQNNNYKTLKLIVN